MGTRPLSPTTIRIRRGAEHVDTFNKTPRSFRKWCKLCGGHLFTEHPPLGLIDETGKVQSAKVIASIHPVYDAMVMSSAKSWRYDPATADGVLRCPPQPRRQSRLSGDRGG